VQASSPLQLTGRPHAGRPLLAFAASTVTLSTAPARRGTIRIAAKSSLSLDSLADTRSIGRQVVEALELAQLATAIRAIRASSTLALSQLAEEGFIRLSAASRIELDQFPRSNPREIGPGKSIDLPATQIRLAQVATSNIRGVAAANQLEVTDSHNVIRPYRVDAISQLIETTEVYDEPALDFVDVSSGLTGVAAYGLSEGEALRQYLQMVQQAKAVVIKPRATDLSAGDELAVDQNARLSHLEATVARLSLSDAAAVELVQVRPQNMLELAQEVEASVDRGFEPLVGLEIHQSTVYVIESPGNRYQYTPFVGESTDPNAPSPPSPTLSGPMDGILAPFQLVYPAEGAVQASVTLRTPEFGNKDRLQFNRINRETRGGTLVIYADPIWPKPQTLVLTFSALLQQQAWDLLTFLEDHLGQEIGLIDHEHRYWRGVITNPDEAVVHDGPDRYTASIEFEGELDPTWNPQVIPTRLYGVSRTSSDPRPEGPYPYVDEMVGVGDVAFYNAEVDAAVQIGTPIYLAATGHANLAQADAMPKAGIVGFAISEALAGFACNYVTEGKVTRDDWSLVASTSTLAAGQVYFLDPAKPGRITSTPPSLAGNYLVRVGRAISPLSLDIEIEPPIRL
jgi:hypothetical protein